VLGKADIDVRQYERSSSVDGANLDRFERHLADMHNIMIKLKIVIRSKSDFYKYCERLQSIKFYYHRGF
jgi:hypothetical protein